MTALLLLSTEISEISGISGGSVSFKLTDVNEDFDLHPDKSSK